MSPGWVRLSSLLWSITLCLSSTAQAQASPVRLRVVTEGDVPLVLSIPSPGGRRMHFDELCIAPCDVEIEPAHYRFGVERRGRRARRVSDAIDVREDMTLRLTYEDRSETRLNGGFVLALGVLGAIGSIVALVFGIGESVRETFGGEPASNAPLIWAILGGAVAVVCVPLGLGLALLKDVVEVRIDPDGAIRF